MESGHNIRLSIRVCGAVQGVGFRPFIYRLSERYHLTGQVSNNSQGVHIEAEGSPEALRDFLCAIQDEAPPRAAIASLKHVWLDPAGFENFRIIESDARGTPAAWILPDIATCPDCLKEILDPADRRYLYPFTNCTHCGPRFTILKRVPYDRRNTSMDSFRMCPECEREYADPRDRRFHAQPNACPACGPHLELWDRDGKILSDRQDALDQTVASILEGKIVAVKGLGGFHLVVDAENREAVRLLRERKRREEKPLALMVPDLEFAEKLGMLSAVERRWLAAPEAPILLVEKKPDIDGVIAPEVAPDNPLLGVMLPYSPLHHILMRRIGKPVVATSGNLSDEPICIDNHEAVDRLSAIADGFLVHDRPILRPVDDSIGRMVAGREMVLRRARGYAPLPISVQWNAEPAVAVGGHLKNTVSIAFGNQILPGQHIGDLETEPALRHFGRIVQDLQALTRTRPEVILHDLHPDYVSTHEAEKMRGKRIPVQHHLAHVLACMVENEIEPPVLGVAWDGAGYGADGTVWGGEFLAVSEGKWERVASFKPFPLPGGDRAAREPRRSALGVLWTLFQEEWTESVCPAVWNAFSESERSGLLQVLRKPSLSPRTSSAGRLFDAVAAMTGVSQINRFEGQAAMRLEYLVGKVETIPRAYPFKIEMMDEQFSVIDWRPMISKILKEIQDGVQPAVIAGRFHESLTEIILEIANQTGMKQLVLSGGCFQNKLLGERSIKKLQYGGFKTYWHQRIPPNDGGISVGQLAALKYGIF